MRRRISAESAADAHMMITAEAVSNRDMIGLRGEKLLRGMPVASHRGVMGDEGSLIGDAAAGVDEVSSEPSVD